MDPVQLVIVGVSIALTTLIIVLGLQVWQILKEVQKTVIKMNKMLDDMGKVTGVAGDGASNLSGLVNGLRAGMAVFTSLRNRSEDA